MNRKQERAAKAAGVGDAPGLALEQVLANAVALHQAGRLAEAEALYRRALAAAPDQPDALHFLGVLLHQKGDSDAAIPYLERSIRIRPDSLDFRRNIAKALSDDGQHEIALPHYRKMARLDAGNTESHYRLGKALLGQNLLEESEAAFRNSLKIDPDHTEAYIALSSVLHRAGDLQTAESMAREALGRVPGHAEALFNLGTILASKGERESAISTYREVVKLAPNFVAAHNNLGNLLIELGRSKDAAAQFRRALTISPSDPAVLHNLGNALMNLGDIDGALEIYQRALAIAPDSADVCYSLGNAYLSLTKFADAIQFFRRALNLKLDHAEARNNLGVALMASGDLREAAAACRRSLELMPDNDVGHSSLLFCMMCDEGYTASDIMRESRLWDERHAVALLAEPAFANTPEPGRRLRVGYVSPDFRTHAVSYFFEPLMAAHDPARVELFCYSGLANPDATTARYRERADHWRVTVGLTDHEVAEQVRADRIDILVDLAGHTAGNRLLAFAERPAPVQLSHLVGYGQSTGMSAMDYLLTDGWMSPQGSEAHYSETPYRLDRCFLSFQPLASWPEITPSPARERGTVAFGSLNSPSRITPGTIDLWARILKEVDGARLILVHGFFRDASIRARLTAAFDAHGLADRVTFDAVERGWPAGMDIYESLDIALDTFPMASATTTAIALWMGLPVITLPGEAVHTRFGVSILNAVGAGDWVAADADDYVSRAVALAGDRDALADLRAGLRARMAASPLLDHEAMAQAVEAAYRDIWSRWCDGAITRQAAAHMPGPSGS